MQRHYKTVHQKALSKTWNCDAPRCDRKGERGFTRKDHLVEHQRNYHHRDIPKRRKGKGVEEDWQPQEQQSSKRSPSVYDEAYSEPPEGSVGSTARYQTGISPSYTYER